MNPTYKTITLQQAIDAVIAYNKGIYRKSGRKNVEIDAEGMSKFRGGLARKLDGLTAQVAWVGRDYGGTAHILASIQLPARIAEAIYNKLDDYEERIRGQEPLIKNPLSESEILFFYQPFQQILTTPKRTLRNWMVWATKFWHFLNPDAFQIMDSHAKRFYQVSAGHNIVSTYAILQSRAREILQSHEDWIPQLQKVDGGLAWSDLKLWDKVAYEAGK